MSTEPKLIASTQGCSIVAATIEPRKTWLKVDRDGVVTEFDEAELERQAKTGDAVAVAVHALVNYLRQGGQSIPEAKREHASGINPSDLLISTFTAPRQGGSTTADKVRGVRVTHLPTGIYSQCTKHRHAYQNRDEALREVKALVKAYYGTEQK